MSRLLEQKDLLNFFRKEVERAGGQSAWSRKAGVHRTIVNQVLGGRMRPGKAIIKALRLRVVYAVMDDQITK
jgi:DNA-binding transcriptional regulator YdaS (Cro superfamily)